MRLRALGSEVHLGEEEEEEEVPGFSGDFKLNLSPQKERVSEGKLQPTFSERNWISAVKREREKVYCTAIKQLFTFLFSATTTSII